MFNAILSTFGSLYLWSYPLGNLKKNIFPLFKSSESLAKEFDPKFHDKVFKLFENILQTHGLEKLKIYISWSGSIMGTTQNFEQKSIRVMPKLLKTDKWAFNLCFMHELRHAKNNDIIKMGILSSVVALSSMYLLRHYYGFSFVSTAVSYSLINFLSHKAMGYYFEYQADRFTIDHATVEELKGGLRLLAAQENTDASWLMNLITSLISTHSSTIFRKKQITAALKRKQIEYIPTPQEIEPLKKLLAENFAHSVLKLAGSFVK